MEKFVLLLIATITAAYNIKVYRSDYTYNPKTNAFYKLHIESRRPHFIKGVCEEEGAKLMEPVVPEDIAQLHGMMKKYPDLGDYVFVENDGQKHASAEEVPILDLTPENDPVQNRRSFMICTALTRSGEIENVNCYDRSRPFICKVDAKNAAYDSQCKTYGRKYHYEPTIGSCYRLSNIAYSWDEAYAECRAENAHLLVVNSRAEEEVIFRLLRVAPVVRDSTAWFFYFAGFRADEISNSTAVPVFKTIFNETLEEAGLANWSSNEPNNAKNHEYCGAIFFNDGKFNDVNCLDKYPFICERNLN